MRRKKKEMRREEAVGPISVLFVGEAAPKSLAKRTRRPALRIKEVLSFPR